ncbi:MAG: polysaccharide lyase, partial [Cyanobacteria bacterium J06636_16]
STQIWFNDDFEKGIAPEWQYESPREDAIEVTNAPQRQGKAARFNLYRDDVDVHSSKRVELAQPLEEAGQEHWYGFSTFIPEDWQSDPSFDIISQWHAYPDFDKGETWRSPPLALLVEGDRLEIHSRWDSKDVTVNNQPEDEAELWSGALEKGDWDDWVFRIKWSHTSDGLMQVWRDDELIIEHEGPNTYNDEQGVYFKAGIYKPDWKYNPDKSVANTREIFIDEVRFGNQDARYEDVVPGNPEPSNPEPSDPEPSNIGEYGTIDINHKWKTVSLDGAYENPVVIVSDPTFNGSDPAAVRVRNVGDNTFQLRLQEPHYKDGWHTNESVSYLVMEAGNWTLADGTRIAADTHTSNRLTSKGFDAIDLKGFASTPTVLSQVQTFNGSDWVTTRTQEQTETGFQLAMQEPESLNNGGHAQETIGWLAIEPGAAASGDTLLQGGMTGQNYDHNRATVSFEEAFSTDPSVIAKLSSYTDSDTANVRLGAATASGFGASVHEEQSYDAELSHAPEAISFLALEGQSGSLAGLSI